MYKLGTTGGHVFLDDSCVGAAAFLGPDIGESWPVFSLGPTLLCSSTAR